MKHKLTDINFENIKYSPKDLSNGTIVNITYNSELLEFQSPKMCIQEILKDSDHEYLLLKIYGNQACQKFFLKILELEKSIGNNIVSLFQGDIFTVKVPFKYSKPMVDVYHDGSFFNYYHLSKGMEIICLLEFHKLWINEYKVVNYNLTIKEIMLLKQ
jgi:hypothetical protein